MKRREKPVTWREAAAVMVGGAIGAVITVVPLTYWMFP